MASRVLTLRRQDRCVRCGSVTPAGGQVYWDAEVRSMLCVACVSGSMTTPGALPAPMIERHSEVADTPQRRQRDAALAAARTGRVTIEELGGAPGREGIDWLDLDVLRSNAPDIEVVQHRQVPGTNHRIDLLVIAPSGVWVIDHVNWSGDVERRDVGTILRVDERLFVGGVDRTEATTAMGWQVEAVRHAIGPLGLSAMPIHPVLCFTTSQWALLARSFRVNGTLISWPAAVAEQIRTAAPLFSASSIQAAADELLAELPAAEFSSEVP